jgi:AraC-like DNA-binding protein
METQDEQRSPRERIEFWHPAGLVGVRGLSVENSWHRWSLFHEAYALTFIRGGGGAWSYRARSREISPNSMMLIEPGSIHVTTKVTSAAAFETLFVDPAAMAHIAERCGMPAGYPHFSSLDSLNPRLIKAFERVHRVLQDARSEVLERTELFEEALFTLFRRACETAPSNPIAPRAKIRRARDLIHDVFIDGEGAKTTSTAGLAGAVGLNPIQLIRGFNALFGLPPYQYLVRLRVARAQHLIEQGPNEQIRSLTDISVEAGFCDLPHMNKFFRRILRMSPTQYATGLGTEKRWARARRRPR